jgi:hypothetical protein
MDSVRIIGHLMRHSSDIPAGVSLETGEKNIPSLASVTRMISSKIKRPRRTVRTIAVTVTAAGHWGWATATVNLKSSCIGVLVLFLAARSAVPPHTPSHTSQVTDAPRTAAGLFPSARLFPIDALSVGPRRIAASGLERRTDLCFPLPASRHQFSSPPAEILSGQVFEPPKEKGGAHSLLLVACFRWRLASVSVKRRLWLLRLPGFCSAAVERQQESEGIPPRLFFCFFSVVVLAVLLPPLLLLICALFLGEKLALVYMVCWVRFFRKRAVARGGRENFPGRCCFLV